MKDYKQARIHKISHSLAHLCPRSKSITNRWTNRLPLPTLFYRPEAVNLGDLLRIWVRAGANRRYLHPNFQGPTDHSWILRELQDSSPKTKTHSPCERIPGARRLMQKRQLFPEFRRASLGRFVLPRRIRGSDRLRYQVVEYGPHSLSATIWFLSDSL